MRVLSAFGGFEFERILSEDFWHIKVDQILGHFLPGVYELLPPGQEIAGVNQNISCQRNFINLPALKVEEH